MNGPAMTFTAGTGLRAPGPALRGSMPAGHVLRQLEGQPLEHYGSTLWQRWCFVASGFFACFRSGAGMWKYKHLLRQAAWESAQFTAPTFWRDINPWGSLYGSRTPLAVEQVPVPDGLRAVYSSYSAAWIDRLAWDTTTKVNARLDEWGFHKTDDTATYICAVQNCGWFGDTPDGWPIIRPGYQENVAAQLPGLSFGGVFTDVLGGLKQLFAVLFMIALVLAVLYFGIKLLLRKLMR